MKSKILRIILHGFNRIPYELRTKQIIKVRTKIQNEYDKEQRKIFDKQS